MHSKFQLRNLTKISEFIERTNNDFQKNDIDNWDQTC